MYTQDNSFKWGWTLWDIRDRYVIGEALTRRGWNQSRYSFYINASNLDNGPGIGAAETNMMNTLFTPESRQHWDDQCLIVDLRLQKAPGKRQLEPEFWKNNPNATPEMHYQLVVNLMGVYPSAASPTIAVTARFDWQKYFKDREATIQTALPYSYRAAPEIKLWQVRHAVNGDKYGGSYKASARSFSQVIGRAKTFQVSVEPCVKVYLGVIKLTDPLGDIVNKGLDKLCVDVVDRVQNIISCAPIAKKAEKFIANNLAKEMIDNS